MDIEKMSFEESMQLLEKLVDDLESETISLDDAMSKFEQGVKLSEYCMKKLNDAEKKIEELTRNVDNETETNEIEIN